MTRVTLEYLLNLPIALRSHVAIEGVLVRLSWLWDTFDLIYTEPLTTVALEYLLNQPIALRSHVAIEGVLAGFGIHLT